MKLFTISDLHLSLSANKPMDIFRGWENYIEKIEKNWKKIVSEEDTVVLPGDFSWGLKLEETLEDFRFLDSLPGKKLLIKGNHDLWWGTAKKLHEFFEKNNICSVGFLFNNSSVCGKYAIAGTRGWFYSSAGDKKVVAREAGRLETSIASAEHSGKEVLVFLHYPPVYGEYVCEEIIEVLLRHHIKRVFHGHIHGAGTANIVREHEGISYTLVSCDCVDFTPIYIP